MDDLEQTGEDRAHFDEELTVPAAITDTGCERELNEDRYAVIESNSGVAWIVCDGMGGESGGELAAQLAIDGMRRDLENLPSRNATNALKSAILEANRVIVLRRQNKAFAQMGTTVVSALFRGAQVAIGHVGDSRAYLVSNSNIRLLTRDHTYVQELVDKGEISPEDALDHAQAHILTRAIGSEPGLKVDIKRMWIWDSEPGETSDVLVLCSDGLYSHVSDAEISSTINSTTPQEACVNLVELAKERGGFDNITVAVIPLEGKLREETPHGYEEVEASALSNLNRKKKKNTQSWGKLIFAMSLLSLLSALLAVAGYFLMK